MTTRKPMPAQVYFAGYFSEPVRAWGSMRFESKIIVSPRTGRMETDAERNKRIRDAGGWNNRPLKLPGSLA